jgi:hypothetical protein
MTYLPEFRTALVEAAHRQQAAPEPTGRGRTFRKVPWRQSMHGGRAILASVVLGLSSTAVGVVQVGPPLGPEPPPAHTVAKPAGPPASVSERP